VWSALVLEVALSAPSHAAPACNSNQTGDRSATCTAPSARASRAKARPAAASPRKPSAASAMALPPMVTKNPSYASVRYPAGNPFSHNFIPDWRLMPRQRPTPYTPAVFLEQATMVKWELTLTAALLVAYGVKNWGWGTANFHAESEGFFGKDTRHGGMDKLGHAFGAMVLADFLNARIVREQGVASDNAALTASLLSFGAMAFIDVADGLAKDHGFSYEDVIADAVGAAFSYFRNTVPGLRDKLDYRVQYTPSQIEDPVNSYMSQKYLLALKLSGFEELKPTPLRFVELHVGYFARGYGEDDARRGVPRTRSVFFGIGLNLNELLFSDPAVRRTGIGNIASSTLEYIQVPYTSINTNSAR
jgi:hypothetical protein